MLYIQSAKFGLYATACTQDLCVPRCVVSRASKPTTFEGLINVLASHPIAKRDGAKKLRLAANTTLSAKTVAFFPMSFNHFLQVSEQCKDRFHCIGCKAVCLKAIHTIRFWLLSRRVAGVLVEASQNQVKRSEHALGLEVVPYEDTRLVPQAFAQKRKALANQ